MQRHEADARHLPGHLRDPDRPAELIGRFPAGDDAADIGHGPLDDEPGFLDAELDGGERIDRLRSARPPAPSTGDAEHADAVHVAEIVLHLAAAPASP